MEKPLFIARKGPNFQNTTSKWVHINAPLMLIAINPMIRQFEEPVKQIRSQKLHARDIETGLPRLVKVSSNSVFTTISTGPSPGSSTTMYLHTFQTSLGPVKAEPLTPENFQPYGGVLSADEQIKNAQASSANYGTAIKLHKVAPVANNFANCKSGKPAQANWNIFRCSAPKHLISGSKTKSYKTTVLERHPYSTQTFVPMGQALDKVSYLVIVADTDELLADKLPNPNKIKAFLCRGNQSVTYGAGTWHAPMVVIDEKIPHIDFGVFIHENGVSGEDCQECSFEPGYSIEYQDPYAARL